MPLCPFLWHKNFIRILLVWAMHLTWNPNANTDTRYNRVFLFLFSIWMAYPTGTSRRNRLPKSGLCDKINFGGCDIGRGIEQPLFIKSKEDGSWTSVQNSAYHFSQASTMSLSSTPPPTTTTTTMANSIPTNNSSSTNKFRLNASNNSINSPNLNNSTNNINNVTSSNQIHLSSFGRADNV